MPCSLFGKLPSKRDFVALAVPPNVLGVWERWLQGGLSTSRFHLKDTWQQNYLRAPIWRFWLGPDICGGTTVAGAFMPSVDGVGRYFPLTVMACAPSPDVIPPPEIDPQDVWFEKVEQVLLSALEPNVRYEIVREGVDRLPWPNGEARAPQPSRVMRLPDGTVFATADPGSLQSMLAALRVMDYARAYATTAFWWTVGGEDFPPLVLVSQRMPDPYLFATFLTGRAEGTV